MNDSIKKTIFVAVALCLVCSIVVSTAAVALKSKQNSNKALDKQKNILSVVNLYQPGDDIKAVFNKNVQARVIDLETGEFVDDIDAVSFDQRKAAKDPAQSIELSKDQDIANIKRRSKLATVYMVNENGHLKYLVLPIHGYGLWSTLYGFIALQDDLNTVYGISYYEHAETPGLGGEVDNPSWKQLWRDKKVYDDGKQALHVVKGSVDPHAGNAEYQIDGLAGASLTSRGVSNMVAFWFGENGYKTFLQKLQARG